MPSAPPACFNAIARFMPAVRAATAKRLVREGLQQERIAEHLGVSQAMVSKYLRTPPRSPTLRPEDAWTQVVDASVELALKEEAKGRIAPWCPVCLALSEMGTLRGPGPTVGLGECLRHDEPTKADAARGVVDELSAAESLIRKLPFQRLVPEVRSNHAMALPDARDSRAVAAFPGRLVEFKDGVRAAAPPEFGSSSHLAQLLLKIGNANPRLRSILNIRADEGVLRAVRAGGLRVRALKRVRGELVVPRLALEASDALLDPGAFGIEPALYLVAPSAGAIVDMVERILPRLPSGERTQ